MSRDYEEYCHTCERHNARSDFLLYGTRLFQCRNCGACWKAITTIQSLKTVGTDEKAWKKALMEAEGTDED